jgi:glucokinase
MAMDYAIGIDVGGTNVKLLAVRADGGAVAQDEFPTVDEPTRPWAAATRERIAAIEQAHGKARWIGVTAPGLAGPDGRKIIWMQGRMAAVQDFDWTGFLERDTLVPVLNDAHAALMGEAWLGAAAGCANVCMLTLGTGVGGAVMCDGRLLRGRLGRAGHLGHLSLDPWGRADIVQTPGSLEDAIGECTLQQRGLGRYASTRALVAAHTAGDALATSVWLGSVRALAAAMVSIINMADPEIFILGGGIAQAGAALLTPLQGLLDALEWRPTGSGVKVVTATLGPRAGALGAAWHAMRQEPA